MGVDQIVDGIMAFIEGDDPGCRLLAAYLEEAGPSKADWGRRKAKVYPTGRAILEADEADQIGVLFAAYRLPAARQLFMKIAVVQPLVQDVFRTGITLSEPDLVHFCWQVVEHSVSDFDFRAKQCVVRSLEKASSEQDLSQTLRDCAEMIETSLPCGKST